MAPPSVQPPAFDFSAFYYRDILEFLIEYRRNNVPEISNDSPFEVGNQLLRAFALATHYSNTLLDMAANETAIAPAALWESVARQLKLIGYLPDADSPAQVVIRAELSEPLPVTTLVIPVGALFATKLISSTPSISFEAQEALTVSRTDRCLLCWTLDASLASWANNTAASYTPASTFGLIDVAVGDHFYVAHANAMTDTLDIQGVQTPLADFGDDRAGTPFIGVWEYHDGNLEDDEPDVVTPVSGGLRFLVDGLVGTTDSRAGLQVTVKLRSTGVEQTLLVEHDGSNNYVDSDGYLGQASPSTTASDYVVGTYWHELTDVVDGTAATKTVTAEAYATADGIAYTWGATLARYPLEPATQVVWNYLSGGLPKTATLRADGSLSGDAATGTTVDYETGVATLIAASLPDAGAITVSYQRVKQPFQKDGAVSFTVPKTAVDDWQRGRVSDVLDTDYYPAGAPSSLGYLLRYRVVSLGATPAADPVVVDVLKWDEGRIYVEATLLQGSTVTETLGTSTGAPNQTFTATKTPYVNDSMTLDVAGNEYTQVDSVAGEGPSSRVFELTIDDDDVATVRFGDGTSGKIPPTGSSILATYRIAAGDNGNVGAGTVVVNKTGLSRLRRITNPRAGTGWTAREGSGGPVDLLRLKRVGVASIRTLERATSPADLRYLTPRWANSAGGKPFSRAEPIEGGFGPKTIRQLVVGPDGATTLSADRLALDAYYNGNRSSGGDEDGVLLINQRVTTEDYSVKLIPLVIEVLGGDREAIEAAVQTFLTPLAVTETGLWQWPFGGTVPLGKIESVIWASDDDVQEVTILTPAADVVYAANELPSWDPLNFTLTML